MKVLLLRSFHRDMNGHISPTDLTNHLVNLLNRITEKYCSIAFIRLQQYIYPLSSGKAERKTGRSSAFEIPLPRLPRPQSLAYYNGGKLIKSGGASALKHHPPFTFCARFQAPPLGFRARFQSSNKFCVERLACLTLHRDYALDSERI